MGWAQTSSWLCPDMNDWILRTQTIIWIALRRLRTQSGLALATALGLLIATALTMSIPLYADATLFRLLRDQLYADRLPADRPPASQTPLEFLYTFSGPLSGGPQWNQSRATDDYLTNAGPASLGLPVLQVLRYAHTDTFQLFPPLDPNNPKSQYFIDTAPFGFLDPFDQGQIRLTDGEFPQAVGAKAASVPVLVQADYAYKYGLGVGDRLFARRSGGVEIPVVVAGLWLPVAPSALVWRDPLAEKLMLVPAATYQDRLAPLVSDEWRRANWYWALNGSDLHSGDVTNLLDRLKTANNQALKLQPKLGLSISPLKQLQAYEEAALPLTLLLYAFSIPIIGLTLAFIGLVTGMFVAQHRNEIAVLRSRGATAVEVVGMTAVEGLVIGAAALGLGIPAGEAATHLIGHSRSFLDFGAPALPRVSLTPATLIFGLAAILFVLLAQIVLPAYAASRRTVVTYKQERARSIQTPLWQRMGLDFVAFLPAFYAIFQLARQSSAAAQAKATNLDPLQNPLLIIAPALTILAVTLFILRVLPRLIATIAWLAARTNSVGFMMAARYLARSPATYNTPLVLLILTLSLSTFTASLALTLDQHLTRQMYYQVGADLSITEQGILPKPGPAQVVTTPGRGTQGAFTGGAQSTTSYLFDPVEDHLRLEGVAAATRLAQHDASIVRLDGSQLPARYFGVDRWSFPQVAFWQADFAQQPLVNLMNSLASQPSAALVSRQYLQEQKLSVGDSLRVNVTTGGALPLTLKIVGSFDLFPGWYPDQGPLIVGNLDYLYRQAGGESPHQVWLKLNEQANPTQIISAVRGFTVLVDELGTKEPVVENGLNTFVTAWQITPELIAAEQQKPERQGLFGLLSVGFLASALLTVLGFLLYAVISFRTRFIEMGMLRAIGLSSAQMTALLASELGFLLGIGVLAGTLFGIGASQVFIPFLQVGVETAARFPPFVVRLAWPAIFEMYALFGALFVVALSVLVSSLLRMKIFQAVKLGETL